MMPAEYLNQIVTGDARELAKRIDPDSAIIVTDPPYNIGFGYDTWGDNLSEENYIEMLCAFQMFRSVVIHYPEETMRYVLPALGIPDHVGAWCYNSNIRRRFRLINYYGAVPDYTRLRQPYKNPTDKRVQELMANGNGGSELYEWWTDIQLVKNVSDEKTEHPCPIPERLAERIILLISNPGDVILDPFCGSGTIPAMAKKNGRQYIGFEISERYAQLARDRVAHTQPPLFVEQPEHLTLA